MKILAQTMIAGVVLAMASFHVQAFEEGRHFERIASPGTTPSDRVEVIEAFAYPCPACRNFHPIISHWEANAPDHVVFRRVPVPLQRGWDLFALAYFTAQTLNAGEEAHAGMFRALHDERRMVRNFDDIAAIYADYGIDPAEFVSTSESFAVDSLMRRNQVELTRFGVRHTPTMIVQGKWRLVPGAFTSYQEMMQAVDYLVAKELEALNPEPSGEAPESTEIGD